MADKDELKEALDEVLTARRSIDEETHRRHHDFVQDEIRRRQQRREFYGRIKGNVFGWLIITVIGGLGLIIWQWLQHVWKAAAK